METQPESAAAQLASADYGERLSGLNSLRQLDPAIAFTLIQPLLTDANVRVRYAAVSQVATLGVQDRAVALELLRDRLLNDPETDVKAAAADALGALQLKEAFPDLNAVYHDSTDWLIQFSIVAALGELGAPESIDLLTEALASPVELVQTTAITALGELGDPRAVDLVLPFVDHGDWQVRYRVAQTLSRFGGEAAMVALTQLAEDPEVAVAEVARGAIAATSEAATSETATP
jgi:HEAT repeat protein